MKTQNLVALVALGIASVVQAREPARLEAMPAELESRLALAAAPPALRADATVYLLDPRKGYVLSKRGTSGLACLVERTQWELDDFRDDLFVPLCYDAAGVPTYLKMIMDTAELRAKGWSSGDVKAEIENRWANKTYQVPNKPGLSYMVAPLMRTVGPPDMTVHTMAMPHLMFYAPFATNEDIGAKPRWDDSASLMHPFVDKQGIAEHTYFIQMIGEAEKARILREEKPLMDALCEYREVLCLKNHH